LIRVGFFYSSLSTWHWIAFVLLAIIYYFCHQWISSLATPTYDAHGKLEDGGADLSKGFCQYYFDIIYITIFVQATTLFISDWLWLTYLVVPIYAAYKLWELSKSTGMFGGGGGGGEEAGGKGESRNDRRKRDREEKKKTKMVKVKGRK